VSKATVLVVGSNATRIEVQGGETGATGQYLNETVVPAMALLDAGYDVVLATPDGTKPHIDEASDSPQHFGGDEAAYKQAWAFFNEHPSMNQVRTLRSVIDEGLETFVAVFVPGGAAPVVDLMQNPELGEILRHFHDRKKPTALLCHGPIASVAAMSNARRFRAALMDGDGAKASEVASGWPYAGYEMTVFSGSEEKVVEDKTLHAKLYFYMPDALQLAGATVIVGPDFDPHVVVDRELITGQNPRSDKPVAAELIQALQRATVAA
jgi:putative intracellular protease/amidase